MLVRRSRRHFEHGGRRFEIDRGVFDPVRHLSGVAFADQLPELLRRLAPAAQTAVDLGTGCGLLAVTMAAEGLSVIATDVDARAAANARRNCAGLDVDVHHGDMFEPLADARADLLVVNPPYERTAPRRSSDLALTSPDFLERFGAQAHAVAPIVLLGFPADEAAELEATGLDLRLDVRVPTAGADLGIFVSNQCGRISS